MLWANAGEHLQKRHTALTRAQLERGSLIHSCREGALEEKQVEGARCANTIHIEVDAVGGDERELLVQLEVSVELHAAHAARCVTSTQEMWKLVASFANLYCLLKGTMQR